MTTRIVVADEAEARFYDAETGNDLRRVGEMTNPAARRHPPDLVSDRPGRACDSAQGALHRRGAVAQQATGNEETRKRREALAFASHIVQSLQSGQHHHAFHDLVLVAGPQFMGTLRAAMPKHLLDIVRAEVTMDLMPEPERAIPTYLSACLQRSVAAAKENHPDDAGHCPI